MDHYCCPVLFADKHNTDIQTQLGAKCNSFMTHQQRWFAWKYNVRRCISTACINIVRSGASAATLLCINIPTPCSGLDHTLRLMCSQELPPLHHVYSFWLNMAYLEKRWYIRNLEFRQRSRDGSTKTFYSIFFPGNGSRTNALIAPSSSYSVLIFVWT